MPETKSETKNNAFSAKDLAQECGTDAKNVRKFLRDHFRKQEQADALPGQGGRYSFTKSEVNSLVKAYKDWATGKVAKKAATAEKAAKKSKAEKEIEDLTEEDIEEFGELDEPSTDEEIEELEEELEV